MSTQLILFPQRYKGYMSTFTNSGSVAPEHVVDGINFSTINSASSATSYGIGLAQTLTTYPPTIINTWYRLRSVATLAYPGSSGAFISTLIFTTAIPVAPQTQTGSWVYQKLSNLIVGAAYTLQVNSIASVAAGYIQLRAINGTSYATLSGPALFSPTGTSHSIQFTAQTPNDIIMVGVIGSVAATFGITSISVQETNFSPSGVYTDLVDGQVICDLYEEENIPLSLSIDDFKNVAEQVKSYSKDFNLPATKRNNRIFNNMFEITRAASGLVFNPYVKTRCVLKENGFILFEGYLRMIDIKDKEGEISYNVNLYSEVIALADTLKEKKFSDLDFTELEHEYNKTQIKYSWNDSGTGITYTNANTSGYRNAYSTLKYPFIDWTHQYIVGVTTGHPQLTSLTQAFRPCIQLKYLINRIFAATDFSWTSEFFDTADFEKLYMDFNWGSNNEPMYLGSTLLSSFYFESLTPGTNYATTSYDVLWLSDTAGSPLGPNLTPPNYDLTTNVLTSTVVNETYGVTCNFIIKNTDSVARDVECQWLYNSTTINYSGVQSIPAGGTYTYVCNFTQIMSTIGDTLKVVFKTDSGTASKVKQIEGTNPWFSNPVTWSMGVTSMTTNSMVQTLRGELGQWDFLKGIMTMFNLVSMVDESDPNNILIEPYADVFINHTNSGNISNLTLAARSIEYDWTDKIDVSQMELKPLTNLNKTTIFKFVEDDDDYPFAVYKNSTSGHLYGSLIYDASEFTILKGEEEIIAEPFAATFSKSLMSQFSAFIVPSIYKLNDDGSSEGFDNSPRIFYNNGVKDTGASYYIPAYSGLASENQTDFLQFSHLSDIPTSTSTRDFVFASEQLPVVLGNPPVDNLYSTYWQPYFNELYNADTRIMTLKVNLNPSDIASFKFYDVVMIKNRSFRVNRIDYKPNDLATVEFILIP